MSSHFSKLSIGLMSLSIMGATSCGIFGGSGGSAELRVLLAAPGVSSVNVLIDNTVVNASLGYGANTGYMDVNSGTRHLQVVPVGATAAIVDESVNVPTSGEVTVIVEGVAPNIVGLMLTDNNTTPASGTAELRLVNAAPPTATVPNTTTDVYVVPTNSSLTPPPTVAALAYGQASGYQNLTVTPLNSTVVTQDYSVFFTEPGNTKVEAADGPISFDSGENRTMVLFWQQGSQSQLTVTLLADLN